MFGTTQIIDTLPEPALGITVVQGHRSAAPRFTMWHFATVQRSASWHGGPQLYDATPFTAMQRQAPPACCVRTVIAGYFGALSCSVLRRGHTTRSAPHCHASRRIAALLGRRHLQPAGLVYPITQRLRPLCRHMMHRAQHYVQALPVWVERSVCLTSRLDEAHSIEW